MPPSGTDSDDVDVGELQRLREQLQRAEARVRELTDQSRSVTADGSSLNVDAMLDALPAMLWFKDTNNRLLHVNRAAAALEGVEPQQINGRSSWDLYPRDEAQTYFEDDLEVIASRQPRLGIIEQHTSIATGQHLWLEVSKVPVFAPDGSVVGIIAMGIDITEKHSLEQNLQNSLKLESLGVLAGGIAHDFNNLLTGIFGYVDVARLSPDCGPRAHKALEHALSAFGRARDLTRQLLTFSRGGAPCLATVDLVDLLRATVGFALSGSNVDAAVHLPSGLWTCQADSGQLSQALDNMLINARQAMPEGGHLDIRAENVPVGGALPSLLVQRDYVRITLTDTGHGIAGDVLPRVFDPFFTTKPQGNGLGLAMTWSIMQRHGGHVEVESVLGEGTTFRLWLPASRQRLSDVVPGIPSSFVAEGRVLVMDDESLIRDLAAYMLRDLGYEVDTVPDGASAIVRYRAVLEAGERYHWVLLDLTVPGGLGGRDTLDRLRELDPEVRAIASSGYSEDPIMASPTDYGFVAGIAKPYLLPDIEGLLARLTATELEPEREASQPQN